jgi:hypothetical protein
MLADAGISPGVMKPFIVLVEHNGNPQAIVVKMRGVDGIVGATAPAAWHSGQDSLVEAFPAIDGAAPGIQTIINRTNDTLQGTDGTLGGVPAVDRDFVHAVYGNFPYVLAFVMALTLILLTRAFRSIVLPIKACSSTWRRSARRSGSWSSSSRWATARRSGTSPRPTRSPPGSH